MVYFARKYRATSVPIFSRYEETHETPFACDIKLYSPQRSAAFVLNDVNELSGQSKKHDRQFVDDVNNIINNANTALYALPPATKPKRRHNATTVIKSHEHHAAAPLAVRRSWSREENIDLPLDNIQTPATNSVLANHRYKLEEKKVFSQPVDIAPPLFKDKTYERRNSVSDVACWQAQNTIDRVNQELNHSRASSGCSHAEAYHALPATTSRRHFVRSVSLAPRMHAYTERMPSRSPSPTLQTIVVANPKITHRVVGHSYDPLCRSHTLIGHHVDPIYRSHSVIGRHVDPIYRSHSVIGGHVNPIYRSHSVIGGHVDPIYRSHSVIGRHVDPIYRNHTLISHNVDPVVRTGYSGVPIYGSRAVIGHRVNPVVSTRSMSVGRLPTNHNEYTKMDTANFLSSAQAILDRPAIYSRNMTSLPSIYSIGGSRHVEPTKTYVYKSYSNTASPIVNSVLNSGHVTSYTATPLVDLNSSHVTSHSATSLVNLNSSEPIIVSPATLSHTYYAGDSGSAERARAPLSEVRRRVRGVLCKVKKDPNYFA